jgi:hypothetical protein
VSKRGGSGVHDVTLRRRSDSESASYAVISIGAHDVFSSYAVIHNDARNPSGNLAATIHSSGCASAGNLAADIHSGVPPRAGNLAALVEGPP